MYQYLKERKHYEDRYDDSTVAMCRSGEQIVNNTFTLIEKKLTKKELKDRLSGWYLQYSQYYFLLVETVAAGRAEGRDMAIAKWMDEDKKKDDDLALAHVNSGTYCRACGKDTHVISKDYMHRDGHKDDEILIMYECDNCSKRLVLWRDGTEWDGAKRVCERCGGNTISKHTKNDKVIMWTETCEKCGYVETDTIDLSDTKKEPEPVDPFLELDRKRFIFNAEMMHKFQQKLQHFERMAKLNATTEDKAQNVDVYDAIKQIKKLKISQLKELLEPMFTKERYSDLKLGDLQIGREVSLDFSCLDAKDSREEYQSKNTLHKAIEKMLIHTNWRLMSAGISYRLGYLTGSLRAYETEDDLKKLVEQLMKNGYVPKVEPKEQEVIKRNDTHNYVDLRESALVYFDKLTLGSVPAEITLKSGKIKQTSIPVLHGEMNPLLRVFIPMRDNDESVPEFIRNYDFKFGNDAETSRMKKDSKGRAIRKI